MDDHEIVEKLNAQADSTVTLTRLLGALAGAGMGVSAGAALESGIGSLIGAVMMGALGLAFGTVIGEGRALAIRAQAAILRRLIEA